MKCPVLSLTSSRRGCGKVGIPRGLRDFQARWESPLLDFSTERLFHGLCRLHSNWHQGRSLSRVVSESMWSVGQGEGCIQMLVHGHRAAGQGAAPADRLALQGQVLKTDGVVLVDCALELGREDQVKILARAGQKR